MKAKTILVCICVLIPYFVGAQNNVVELFNEVKANPDYCYGEGADEDPQKALDCAIDDLCDRLIRKSRTEIDRKEVTGKMKILKRQRGSQTRMLAYVNLADFNISPSATAPSSFAQTTIPTTVQTAPDQMAQPYGEADQQTTAQNSMTTTTPDSQYNQQTIMTMNIADYTKAKDVIEGLKRVKHLDALNSLLNVEKKDGRVKDYGKSVNVVDNEMVYWCIYRRIDNNRMQYVAVLSPIKTNGRRENLDNGMEQTPADYSDRRNVWIWFTLP